MPTHFFRKDSMLPFRLATAMALTCGLGLTCVPDCPGAEPTRIEITDKVVFRDCSRFGINLCGDTYYSGAALVKKRVRENFEGTTYRQCHFGPEQDATGATTWFSLPKAWCDILIGGRYTILSGPAKGMSGTIADITTRTLEHQGKPTEFQTFVFDRPLPPGPPNTGILVEAYRLDEGQFQPFGKNDYWTSHTNRIDIGDTAPDSFGCAALLLGASEKEAHVRFATHYHQYGELNGNWTVRFRAKIKTGTPTLRVGFQRTEWGESSTVALTSDWQQFDLSLRVTGVPEPKDARDNPHLLVDFSAENGEVLIDDVEAWLNGDENPTAFRDDLIAALKAYRPGCIRFLQMGGNTLRNTLMPPLRAHAFTSSKSARIGPNNVHERAAYSLHQLYELCEYLECEPWYSLPGTLSYEEMSQFMEYVGAPADVGYGKLRAELGHPQPWTETLGRIHVEFGNEAWNNAGPYQCGGFNGQDYWKDLIEIGKRSPYASSTIVFHAGGQAANPWRNRSIMEHVPNADRFSVAPYIIQSLTAEQMEIHTTDDALFRWAFAWPLWRSRNPDGAMYQNTEMARRKHLELSVYEINYHITNGDGPLEPRNRIVSSIGGGLNVANTMLQLLAQSRARTQALFALAQHSYNAQGIGRVRLWGTALCMRRGHERYRPTFLACATANRVLGGDVVETVHSGPEPTFEATGVFSSGKPRETLRDLPCIYSYAFRDRARRGLILINLDTKTDHLIEIRFQGKPSSPADGWLLDADTIAANNEFEQETPQVTIRKASVRDFESGRRLVLPAHSMIVLAWRQD